MVILDKVTFLFIELQLKQGRIYVMSESETYEIMFVDFYNLPSGDITLK